MTTTPPVVTVTDELLEELEQLASAATPGPWRYRKSSREIGVIDQSDTQSNGMMLVVCQVDEWDFKDQHVANAGLIARANPSTILALLHHIRTMQQELKAAHISVDNCELFRKDAERYQWLRNPETDPALVIDKRGDFVARDEAAGGGYYIYEYRAGEELDAAIDAAMAASHSS